MIMQYLGDEGYNASQMTIQDESNVKWHEREENTNDTRRLKKAILGKLAARDIVAALSPRWKTESSWWDQEQRLTVACDDT